MTVGSDQRVATVVYEATMHFATETFVADERLEFSDYGIPVTVDARAASSRSFRASRGTDVKSGRENTVPCHSQLIAYRGACGKTRVMPQNRRPEPGNPRHCRMGGS